MSCQKMGGVLRCVRWIAVVCVAFSAVVLAEGNDKKTRILLVGDSTTIGSLPRKLNPDGPQLEQLIEQLGVINGLPELEVINAGKGGETAKRLLGSPWYEARIAKLSEVDYIFLRMGINDWFRCDDLEAEFPKQMKDLITRLQEDHPQATVILSTICRFMPHPDCVRVNELIKRVAKEEGLDLFDLYTPYNRYLEETGPNQLNVRQIPLKKVPEKYHDWLTPYTRQSWWKGKRDEWMVQVNDSSLDPILGHIKGWYGDRHPNTAGYNLIAVETVRFLTPLLGAAAEEAK